MPLVSIFVAKSLPLLFFISIWYLFWEIWYQFSSFRQWYSNSVKWGTTC